MSSAGTGSRTGNDTDASITAEVDAGGPITDLLRTVAAIGTLALLGLGPAVALSFDGRLPIDMSWEMVTEPTRLALWCGYWLPSS